MKRSLVLAVLLFAACLAFGDGKQIITMDDGTKLTLLGTTYGSHHMAPGYEHSDMADKFPNNTKNGAGVSPGTPYSIDTASNTVVVWIKEEPGTNSQPIELLVSDRANTGCVHVEADYQSFVNSGMLIHSFRLFAFPRWDRETILRVRPYRGAVVKGEFVITNPSAGTAPRWTPKPLPDTESDGDLEVTLNKMVVGARTPSWGGGSLEPANDPVNQCVHLNFDFRQNGRSTTNWAPWPVQTTDAAGNWSRGLLYPYPTNGIRQIWGQMKSGAYIPRPENYRMDGYYFGPGLWPNQPWKVRLEFIQQSGFSADELVTFTNVPVKAGSRQDWEDEWSAWDVVKRKGPPTIPDSTALIPASPPLDDATNFPFTIVRATVKDVHLKLLPPLLMQNDNSSGHPKDVNIVIGADPGFNPRGMNLTVVSATDDQGRDLWSFETPAWAGHYSIEFARVHEDIKSVNLTLALHKSRFVEFTVQPEKVAVATNAP